ncbi:hypothetical protein PIB30_002513 [Stylosanthes scabra]|uniref:Uncharacterized protein n=1 Tax=Stylosanthes scabra TaxID=79078 RepID=A0ABU6Y373_9FABA|nr:hypothetical protein [Stylosanthes scabra]
MAAEQVVDTSDQQVLDTNGNPIFPGREYYILPAIRGPPGGGLKLGKTGNSKCPVTILQDYSETHTGFPVKFTIPGTSTLEIYEDTPLEIEFIKKPECVESSKWIVFIDYVKTLKACVGIGSQKDHPQGLIFHGTFKIEKYGFGYKLLFCTTDYSACDTIGTYDNYEGGKRLTITARDHAFDIEFVDSSSFYNNNNVTKSVV